MRYDIVYDEVPNLIQHICRTDWCYGTNPNHGYDLEEGVNAIVEILQKWKELEQDGNFSDKSCLFRIENELILWDTRQHPNYLVCLVCKELENGEI